MLTLGLGLTMRRGFPGGGSNPTHIFVIAGQSNAVGQAPEDGGALFPAGTMHYNASDSWQPIVSRVYHNQSPGQTELPAPDASFGFARQFAISYAAANPGVDLYFIGAAKGSTSFVGGNWNPGDAVYNASVARVNAALAAAPAGAILKGILWHQGESDKLLSGEPAFEAAFKAFIPAYRAAITGGANIPMVIGGPFIRGGAYGETIQNVQQSMPNAIAYTGYADQSSPVEVTLQGDSLHATAASMRAFGPQYLKGLVEAEANANAAPSATITVGTPHQYALSSALSQTIGGVDIGAEASDRIICLCVHSRSSFALRVMELRLGGIDMIRMGTPEIVGTQCNTAMFYAKIPTGTTASLEIIMDVAPNATQFGVSVLPVYGARMHLARPLGASHARNAGTSVTSIATAVDVLAGELIIAGAGSINTGSNVGTFASGSTISGQFGGTFAAHLGWEIAAADAAGKSVSCSFSTATQKPTISAFVLRPS